MDELGDRVSEPGFPVECMHCGASYATSEIKGSTGLCETCLEERYPEPRTESEELEAFAPTVDFPIDTGIRYAVLVLRRGGVETFESCEGGPGHASPDPMIRFYGDAWAGYRAFSVAMEHGLPVLELRRVHDVYDGQLNGPWWVLVFRPTVRSQTTTIES